MLRFVRQEVAGCVGGAPRRGVVVVRVALEGERLGGVTGEGLVDIFRVRRAGKGVRGSYAGGCGSGWGRASPA